MMKEPLVYLQSSSAQRPSENGIGGRWSIAVIFLTRTEESSGAEEDSSNLIRAADYLDLPHI